ncbi:MAG: GNAT family N-acetyltransferase [Lachnospiraceae bacterium]|jgi:ribosomal protein S18 acetylase RimI-like enzyme|nr:GNAT family N-acetyltransferase [Lachnospiraceae bacterium]
MANKKTYEDAIEELSLMLMYLTREQDRNEFCRYREISWKGYDFGLLDKLGQEEMIYQPRSRRGYDKYLYLTEEGRHRAKALLEEYGLSDKDLNERFLFRDIRPEEAGQAAEIERICFPPHEACTEAMMKERVCKVPELFLAAEDKSTGRVAGFVTGIATDEDFFRDEFFKVAGLHNPEGSNVMILGLDVLPEYRRQGLGKEIMFQFLRRESKRGRKLVTLTCLDSKVKMYERMGFQDRGLSGSSWGGEKWHEMSYVLNI